MRTRQQRCRAITGTRRTSGLRQESEAYVHANTNRQTWINYIYIYTRGQQMTYVGRKRSPPRANTRRWSHSVGKKKTLQQADMQESWLERDAAQGKQNKQFEPKNLDGRSAKLGSKGTHLSEPPACSHGPLDLLAHADTSMCHAPFRGIVPGVAWLICLRCPPPPPPPGAFLG